MSPEELVEELALFFWDASPTTPEASQAQQKIEAGADRWPIGFRSVEDIRESFSKILGVSS
jgi:hypothetical protein